MSHAMAEQNAGGNARIAHHHGLDPFGRDVTTRRGDEQIVFPSRDRDEAVLVAMAEIASPPRRFDAWSVKIALHDRRSAHDDLAVFNTYIQAAEGLAHGSRFAATWSVHCDHRAAFGEAIAFM